MKREIEAAAEHIYAAMVWAKNTGGIANPWVAGGNSDAQMQARRAAETILKMVPSPVPTPEPEYIPYKGVTYRSDGYWHNADGWVYSTAAACITESQTGAEGLTQESLTDDDHAALLALKANPVKVAPTPATVASEPAAPSYWLNSYADMVAVHHTEATARDKAGYGILETAVPLYRHPATEAEALAVLVKLGYRNLIADDSSLRFAGTRRVLIAPEGAAHE